MIENSGLEKQISQLKPMLEQQVGMLKGKFDEKFFGNFSKTMTECFDAKSIISEIKREMSENYNEAYAKKILTFLDTDEAKYFTKLEVDATRPEMFKMVSALDIKKIQKSRIKILNDFIQFSKINEFTIAMVCGYSRSIFNAANAVLSIENKIPEATISSVISTINDKYNVVLSEASLKSLCVTYQSVDDKKLSNYLNRYKTVELMWMTECLLRGLSEGMNKFGATLGEQILKKKI